MQTGAGGPGALPRELAEWGVACALFGALAAALFAPVLLAGRVLAPGDAMLYYYPHYASRPALWTTALYAGYPVFADPQAMTWYPPALLLRAIPGSWNVFVVLAYAIAGGSMFAFVRRLTGSRGSGAVSGLVYAGSGFAIAHLEHTSLLHTFAWAPAVLWTLEALRRSSSGVWPVLVAASVALAALAGHPQVFAYCGLLALGYALLPAGRDAEGRRSRLRGVAALALGVGLAGVMFVPLVQLAAESVRSASLAGRTLEVSLAPRQLLQLLLPYLYGGQAHATGVVPSAYRGGESWVESTGFVGLVPLVLAALALRLRPRRVEVRFFAVITVVALALCLGEALPFAGVLARIPGLDRFRAPARLLAISTLSLSALAGIGLDALRALPAPRRTRTLGRALTVAGGLVALAWLGAATIPALRQAARPDGPLVLGGIAASVVAAGALWLAASRPRRVFRVALLAALALELASCAVFAVWRDSPAPAAFAFPEPLRGVHDDLARSRQRSVTLSAFGPALTAPPNRNELWGIPSVIGYGPLPLARYAELLRLAPAGHLGRADELARLLGPSDRSLDLLAARYLLIPGVTRPGARPDPFLGTRRLVESSGRWRRHAVLPGVGVYENEDVLPRAWIAGASQNAAPDEVLQTIRSGRLPGGRPFDPRRTALIEDAGAPLACPDPCGEVEIESLSDTEVRLRARARGTAMLVSSDVAYPGWRARVDGAPAPIVRTDFVLRGVRVPAGDHQVVLSFQPGSLWIGGAVSLASLSCLASWLLGGTRRRRHAHVAAPAESDGRLC